MVERSNRTPARLCLEFLTEGGAMAEQTITVCDVCGAPAVTTVSIRAGGRSLTKDLCRTHVQELTSNARPARRGRPRSVSVQPAQRSRTRGRPAGRATARKGRAKAVAKSTRRRITDPATLEKRRAAMAKAREALAAKRAAAKKKA